MGGGKSGWSKGYGGYGYGKGKASKGTSSGSAWSPQGWEQSWDAGCGSASSKGNWSNARSNDWPSASSAKGWGATEDKGKGKEWVSRLEGRYAFAKSVLRPYADDKGNAVYAATGGAQDLFSKSSLRQLLTSNNSELARRPAVGVSTISSSLLSLLGCIEDMKDASQESSFLSSLQQLQRTFSSRDAATLKQACETLQRDRTRPESPEKLRKALEVWLGFFRSHKEELQAVLPRVLASASVVYLGGVQALEALTLVNALTNWSSKVPATSSNEQALATWQAAPTDISLLLQYLVDAFGQRHLDDAAWRRCSGGFGGDSDEEGGGGAVHEDAWGVRAVPEPKPARREPSSSSTSSSARRRRRARKAARKAAKESSKAEESGKGARAEEPSKANEEAGRVGLQRLHGVLEVSLLPGAQRAQEA